MTTSQLEPITNSNSTSGAGAIDSWHSVASAIESLKNAHGADRAAIAVEIGVGVVSGVLDTVALILDPFAKLISAGLGWLIEHIKFLRWPLDQIAGNPDQIKVIADNLHTTGQNLRNTASDMNKSRTSTVTQWQGAAYDNFNATMTGHEKDIDNAGHAVDTAGYVVETTMALISAVRSLFRDLITTILGDFIATMLIALAMAFFTFGASIVAGVTKCVIEGTVQAASMAAKLAKALSFSGRSSGRLNSLSEMGPQTTAAHELDNLPSVPHTNTGGTHTAPPPHPSTSTSGPTHTATDAPTVAAPPHPTPGDGAAAPHPAAANDGPTVNAPPHTTNEPAGPTQPAAAGPVGGGGANAPAPHPTTPAPSAAKPPAEDPFQTWLAADNHFNGPSRPGTPTDGAPPAPAPRPVEAPPTTRPPTPADTTPPAPPATPTPRPATPPETTPTPVAGPSTTAAAAPHETPPAQPPTLTPADATPTAHPATPPESTPAPTPAPHPAGEPTPAAGPTTPPGAPVAKPTAQSIFKDKEIKFMKAHEGWLQKVAPNSYDKMKYVDDKIKTFSKQANHPDLYTYWKSMSDAKSSKTWVGWIGKDVVNLDRQLTDIYTQAQQAWDAANAQHAAQNQNPTGP